MSIFEYPYVIITILVFAFLIIGAVGAIFAIKGFKTANGTEERDFVGVGRLENEFEKSGRLSQNRCLVYVGLSLDTMSRLYSESQARRIIGAIKPALLDTFCDGAGGMVAIYGEESFVAVTKWSREEAAEAIQKCICETGKIIAKNEAVNIVQIRFGYYCTGSGLVTFSMATSRAKQAFVMAESQNASCCEWDNSNGKKFEKKIKIENTIQDEIDNNRFFLEYQPILDAHTRKAVGAEVLARLNSQSDGVLTPGAFLSAVNSVGINDKFDYYIFDKNCKWISNNKKSREKYVYTINFSRTTLCDTEFSRKISAIVDKYGLNYSSIAIEVLEDKNLTPEQRDVMIANLSELKARGVLILLDDFGSGYTSFLDLSNFAIDIVKLDKAVVHNAVTPDGFLLLKNMVRTAKDLNLKTLCEGVENEEHEKAAIDAGCDMLQGYYYYRPMPVTQLEKVFGSIE